MSVDGHIFLTKDIVPLIESKYFRNPNELESILASGPIKKPFMMCYDYPKLINLAMNRVQNTFPNRCGNIRAEYLNNYYLSGGRIALEPIEEFTKTVNSFHIEYEPEFIR